jgi:hypothetical protein
MKNIKHVTVAACAAVTMLFTACSDNNTDAAHNEKDTNLLDSRRYSDTTSNYITGDSAGTNLTPSSGGTGLEQ